MGSWAIMALNAVLFGGCCFLVANIVTQIAGEVIEPDGVDLTPPTRIETSAQAGGRAAAPSMILDRNLFGAQLAGEVQVVERTDEPLSKTKLPLRLLGTAAASEVERSRAAIENEKTRKHIIVAVGDPLEGFNRVRVERIERTRVVLDNSGRAEELLLHEDQPRPNRRASAPKKRDRKRPTQSTADVRNRLKELAAGGGDGITKLLSQARITPKFGPNSQVLGMQVDAIKAGSLFETAGLQNGDVITEVNGIVIDRQDATPAVLEELLNADTIEIAADRGGNTISLSANPADILEQP